jgi:hypothetical protein
VHEFQHGTLVPPALDVAFLRHRRGDTQTLTTWRERNRHALREFWARAPADALGVKQEFEKALAPDGKPTK